MTRRSKLQKYQEVKNLPNVIENKIISSHPPVIEKTWDKNYFKNNNDIVLELGCGQGEYTVNLAKKFPDKNFIGIEIKGARLWHVAMQGHNENISNVLFVRMQAEHLHLYFPKDSISEIWLTFPVPYPSPNPSNGRKRFTSQDFLKVYQQILKPNGLVHLKTDNEELYSYTLDILSDLPSNIIIKTPDLYNSNFINETLSIKTFFEKKYLKEYKKIKYIQFRLN